MFVKILKARSSEGLNGVVLFPLSPQSN